MGAFVIDEPKVAAVTATRESEFRQWMESNAPMNGCVLIVRPLDSGNELQNRACDLGIIRETE